MLYDSTYHIIEPTCNALTISSYATSRTPKLENGGKVYYAPDSHTQLPMGTITKGRCIFRYIHNGYEVNAEDIVMVNPECLYERKAKQWGVTEIMTHQTEMLAFLLQHYAEKDLPHDR